MSILRHSYIFVDLGLYHLVYQPTNAFHLLQCCRCFLLSCQEGCQILHILLSSLLQLVIMVHDLLSLIADKGSKAGSWKFLSFGFNPCYYCCCWSSSNNIVPHLVKLDAYLSLMLFFNDIFYLLNSGSIKRKFLGLSINFFIQATLKLYFENTLKMLKILSVLFIGIV